MVAMVAIALAGIVAGNYKGNSGGSGSSGSGGSYDNKDIGGYSNGRGHRQQSTKSRRGINGGGDGDGNSDNNDNSKDNDGGNGNSGDGSVPTQ
jgi:hypothetical protein